MEIRGGERGEGRKERRRDRGKERVRERKQRSDLLLNGCEFSLRGDGHTLELMVVIAFGFAEFIKNH